MKLKFIIIDRLTRARDNGEYFYRYLKENHPEVDILFGLHKDSDDWARLKKDGFNLIDLSAPQNAKNQLANCTHFLFSEANIGYDAITKFLDRDTVTYIYLNHGCYFQRNEICYPIKKFDYMICGNHAEYDAIQYNAELKKFDGSKYLLTGFPRMDEQVKRFEETEEKNLVIIQPWWRENLTGWRVVEKNNKISDAALTKLKQSDFIAGFNKLLNSKEFEAICKEHNLQVVFKRHPVMEHIPGVFKVPEWIIDEPKELFIDLFAKTKLYITDYSSNTWEVANLGIPCIYFEPDYNNLITNCKRPETIWNVKKQGIGPVTFTVSEFLTSFKKLLNNNYTLDAEYIKRRNEQIAFLKDKHNSERCFNAISKLVKNRQPVIVTMTSWLGRINNVVNVLKTVLNQTVMPDKIFLNLSKEEFKDATLPAELITFIKDNPIITLNWVDGPNTKPFKKIFPILNYLNDDDIIINIDDDMLLPEAFIESRLRDFKKYKTCISGIQSKPINGYAGGLLPEVRHWMGAGSVYQKKMFNNWEKLLNKDIIDTNHDDAFYCFLSWLNGWLPESCSEFDAYSISPLAEDETSIHGQLGCHGPKPATLISIERFKKVFNATPKYNYFNNKTPVKIIPFKKPEQKEKKKDIRADGQSNTFLYF